MTSTNPGAELSLTKGNHLGINSLEIASCMTLVVFRAVSQSDSHSNSDLAALHDNVTRQFYGNTLQSL